MSVHRDLLHQARRLARMDSGRPRQANLRRAISSAYYSLFHYLVECACRTCLGAQQSQLAYRRILARGFEHGSMKNACRAFARASLPAAVARGLPATFSIPLVLRDVAQAFVELQEQRHLADYDLMWSCTRAEALTLVQQAENARTQFEQWDDRAQKRFFLACLMTWKSLSNRG